MTIILEFGSYFSGKNPILEIPNDQNREWYPLFDPYEFATRTVRHRWFFSVRGEGPMMQVNGNNGSRKQVREISLTCFLSKQEFNKVIYYHRNQFFGEYFFRLCNTATIVLRTHYIRVSANLIAKMRPNFMSCNKYLSYYIYCIF